MAGLKVIDLGTWWVGALAGTVLASFGADVVKVESTRRVDGSRLLGGSSGDSWWERSAFFLGTNHNKRDISLDFTTPEGRTILVRLIEQADVLLENYAPRVLESLGLNWESVRAINPRIVMLRMPAFGLTGPRRDMVGYAQTVEQFSGMCWRTGFAEGEPLNPGGPPDPMGGANAAFALLAALHHRERTGEGMLVEAALAEAALVMTSEQVLEWTANGRLLERDGNHHVSATPQGAYRGTGTEQWLALSVDNDARWATLKDIVAIPRWQTDRSLDTQPGRYAQRVELDGELTQWMAGHSVEEVLRRLLSAGIPAAKLQDPRFVHEHPQVAARSFYEYMDHAVLGTVPLPVLPYARTSKTGWSEIPPPTLGQHTEEVLVKECGITHEQLRDYTERGITGTRPRGL